MDPVVTSIIAAILAAIRELIAAGKLDPADLDKLIEEGDKLKEARDQAVEDWDSLGPAGE